MDGTGKSWRNREFDAQQRQDGRGFYKEAGLGRQDGQSGQQQMGANMQTKSPYNLQEQWGIRHSEGQQLDVGAIDQSGSREQRGGHAADDFNWIDAVIDFAGYPSSSSQDYAYFPPGSSYTSPGSVSQASGSTASPSLPALETSTNGAGFSDLFRQIEAQMDEIQARHSPFSSPRASASFQEMNSLDPSHSSNYSQSSGNTSRPKNGLEDSPYITSHIMSSYQTAGSPSLAAPSQQRDQNFHQQAQGTTSRPTDYQTSTYASAQPNFYVQSHPPSIPSVNPEAIATGDQSVREQYVREQQVQHNPPIFPVRSSSYRQPSPYDPRMQMNPLGISSIGISSSAASVSSASSPQTSISTQRPSWPSTQSQATGPPPLSRPTFQSQSSRPIHDSNGYSSSIAPTQILPRSLTYSQNSRQAPAVARRESGPYTYSSSPLNLSSTSSSRESSSTSQSIPPSENSAARQRHLSEFAKEFYAAGGDVSEPVKYPQNRSPSVRRKESQSAPIAAGPHLVSSSSYGESIQRQPITGSSTRSSPSGQSSSSQNTFGPGATSDPHTVAPVVSSPAIPNSAAVPLVASANYPSAPSMYHSQSDPSVNSRNPYITPIRQQYYASPLNTSLEGSYMHDPSSPLSATFKTPIQANRSTSFSLPSNSPNASVASPAQYASYRPNGTSSQYSGLAGRATAEALPSVLSSPSISISRSIADTSFSSATSTFGPRPWANRQTSLSPSSNSLSASANFGNMGSLMTRRDSQKDRRRLEEMGLQHFNPALLSHLATASKDRVPKGMNVKGAIHFPKTFTGDELVSTVAEILPSPYMDNRPFALAICRLLQRMMFYHEAEWDLSQLRDSPEQIFSFEEDEQQSTFDYLNSSWETSLPSTSTVPDGLGRMPNLTNMVQDELPNGVITRFTKCYSPFCGMAGTTGSGSCYSLYCPNGSHPLGLQRTISSVSLSPTVEEPPGPEAWASNASPELIEQLGPTEVARQNVIFEIIKGEQDYKKDLDMFETAFHEPLREANPPIIHPARLTEFTNQVFANLDELRAYSGRFINILLARQREQTPVVQSIGDIILDAALEWGQAYMDYAEATVNGEYLVNEEKNRNSAFSTFLTSRREAFGIKQDFRHYHLRAPIRLQRYLLPLADYVKRTSDDHPDKEPAQEAMRIIAEQCSGCDLMVANAQLKLACYRYDKILERDVNWSYDLDLGNSNRQLFIHSKMYAKPEGTLSEWTELQVMLFDHYLVIAKPRRTVEGYRLIRKPIRLELLSISGFEDPAQTRSSGFHLRSVISTSERREERSQAAANGTTESKVWPIVFKLGGRSGGTLTLYIEGAKNDKDDKVRRDWKVKLEQAIAVRLAAMDANKVFRLNLLVDPESRSNNWTSLPAFGRVTSSCPFTGATGQPLIAIGTSTGLFIASRQDPSTLRQTLPNPILACAVLQDFGMFMVQTEGRLLAYLLDTLVQAPTTPTELKGQQGPQQVSGQKDITFFKVGRVGDRTLVVYAKKDGVNSTVLKAMEPIAGVERTRVQQSRFLGMGGKKTEWFRLYKDGEVPTEVYTLSFTRSKLALVCAPGFEILDIETLKTGTFPDWAALKADHTRYDAKLAHLQRRCSEARAIGLFRISDSEFLFCYDTFAFFADRHGDPLPDRYSDVIDWEGHADSVAFYRPYILAFDSRFVEVRDLSQGGKLVQLIRGVAIRCSYDGQGVSSSEIDVRPNGTREAEERKPHMVTREGNNDKIYELAPCSHY